MTAEEAIKELRDASDNEVRYGDTEHHYNEVMKRIEAFDLAIKTLEQKPCEDYVSREAVKEQFEEVIHNNGSATEFLVRLWKLPSVTPTRPTARWERLVEDYNKCSKCGEMGKLYRIYKYCPNCGAIMTESEE